MKFDSIILIILLLLTILSLSVVNAQDNSTCNLGVDESFDDLAPICEVSEDMQTDIDEKVDTSSEDVVGEINSDNVTINVSNVFKGQNATISINVPKATGTVNITIGEKLYTPEFIDGVAIQSISEYSIGLNNITIKYNDIEKQTSFKALDGVITSETVLDYLENHEYSYVLASYIPENATLDFRGNVFIKYEPGKTQNILIQKSLNLISSTKDAFIDFRREIIVSTSVTRFNISNIQFNKLRIYSPNTIIINSTITELGNFYSNSTMINCTVDNKLNLFHDGLSNLKLFNSTFNEGICLSATYMWKNPINNITIKNCVISGKTEFRNVKDTLIENCTFNDGYVDLKVENLTFNNNYVNVPSSKYAIHLSGIDTKECKFTNNRVYSKNYCGNNAIVYQIKFDVNFWPETNNIFTNNTPAQTNLNIGFTTNTIFYDENTTVVVNIPGMEGNVAFYLNNKKISTIKLINGIAIQAIGKYELGINNVSAIYEDLVNDIWGINHTSFKVNQVSCPVKIVCDGEIEEKIFSVNVVLPNDANGNLTLFLSNTTHSITIKQYANGANNIFTIPSLLEGNYNISATFSSIKYVTNSSVFNFNVVHVPVYKLIANNVVMDYGDGSKYKVLLTRDGKAVISEVVKIIFNGKTINIKTDKNGYATLTLNGAPKTYLIKVVYNGISKSGKITIKNVLKAKNISKKKSKTVKFLATLKTSKGKAISGKKITFKIKSKTYFAKTNKKGVATILLKKLKVGKYSITSKYGACTVKNTIKIKK